MKIFNFLVILLVTNYACAQDLTFKTKIQYYLNSEECLFPNKSIALNGLNQRTYADVVLLKNDQTQNIGIDECDGLRSILIQEILNGEIDVYNTSSNQLLTNSEFENIWTREIDDLCTGEPLRIHKYDEFRLFEIDQIWHISGDQIQSKIQSITIIELDESDEQVSSFTVKFDQKYQVNSIINEKDITYISIVSQRVGKNLAGVDDIFGSCLDSDKFAKYDCSEQGIFSSCDKIENDNEAKKLISVIEGYSLIQFFYYNIKTKSLNSKFIGLSGFSEELDKAQNFKYYESRVWIKNSTID